MSERITWDRETVGRLNIGPAHPNHPDHRQYYDEAGERIVIRPVSVELDAEAEVVVLPRFDKPAEGLSA